MLVVGESVVIEGASSRLESLLAGETVLEGEGESSRLEVLFAEESVLAAIVGEMVY